MRLALLSVVAIAGTARAAPHGAPPVLMEPAQLADGSLPRVLFLDRCANGCTVLNTANDATTNNSTIPMGKASYSLSAFAFGDAEWAAIVKCVKDVFSPYDMQVTDVKPDPSTLYDKTFVAGLPTEIGQA